MSIESSFAERINTWFDQFGSALDAWEGYLEQVEQAYVSGDFLVLTALEATGLQIQNELLASHESRSDLLSYGRKQGISSQSVTGLIGKLSPMIDGRHFELRLRMLTQQLQRVQQMSAALWVTSYQASGYATALLGILATGQASQATYGDAERSSLEGGRIMDAAA